MSVFEGEYGSVVEQQLEVRVEQQAAFLEQVAGAKASWGHANDALTVGGGLLQVRVRCLLYGSGGGLSLFVGSRARGGNPRLPVGLRGACGDGVLCPGCVPTMRVPVACACALSGARACAVHVAYACALCCTCAVSGMRADHACACTVHVPCAVPAGGTG